MRTFEELYRFLSEIDHQHSLLDKILHVNTALNRLDGVRVVRTVCDERMQLSSKADSVIPLSANQIQLLPRDIAVLNGRAPIPESIFPEANRNTPTVVGPIVDSDGTHMASFLLKGPKPRQIAKRHEALLGILASKLREPLAQRRQGDQAQSPGSGQQPEAEDPLSPESLGRLMDRIGLPMYVAAPGGTVRSVNTAFLRRFGYRSLEEVQGQDELFIQENSWADEIRRAALADEQRGTLMQVRTGDAEVRSVQEHASLVGKHLFSVLFDVTDYLSVNEELQEALSAQRTLNERLSATTTMLQKTQATAMKSLAKLAEYRDKETGGHLQRICNYMRLIGNRVWERQPYDFRISHEYVDDLFLSGMLHDIGKVGIPDTILLKQGQLNESEWEIMRKHPELGWSILNQADKELGEQSFLTLAARIALYHHERYDGEGYPYGIYGESIPLSARIAAVADVYDALTSTRPYKPAWRHDDAVREIRSERGRHFDPVLVDLMLESEEEVIEIRNTYGEKPNLLN
jgi:response regulator RpfG family c-di-GMP phosphodiesterase